MPCHLFLYGTLLPELAPPSVRHQLLRLQPIGTGCMPGRLYDLGSYPGAVIDDQAELQIKGEVFLLPEESASGGGEILATLDQYEDAVASDGSSGLFARRSARVTVPGAGAISAWVYVYNRDPTGATLIPHGDYRRWLRERKR